ncbi:MAG: hypothetical protein IJP75_03770 [Bacteroidaceae bacterium]|nr:hypothetical protein [Bacteroidaceae bacterium]
MRKISLYLMFLTSAVFVASCDKPNVQLHTIIHEDGRCEREVSYHTVMSKEMRDSLWGGNNVAWAQPLPECLNTDAFMSTHTDVDGDTVTTTFSISFNSVEEMCQQTPLNLNGSRIQSKASLEKRFRWFYTEYAFTETFISVTDTFKLPVTDYADKDVVSFWFTGQPNLTQGLSGAEASEKLKKMEPLVDKWLTENLYQTAFEYMVENYDSIPNPPISKELFVSLHDSLASYMFSKGLVQLDTEPQDVYKEFFHSDAYAKFFDDTTPLGAGLSSRLATQLDIFWFDVPYSLTMPGTVINPGAGIIKEGAIYYPLTGERLIPGDYTITATSRVTHIWAYVVTILIILLAIGSFIYKGRTNRGKTR